MQIAETPQATNPGVPAKPTPIASWRHLVGFLLIMAGIAAWGFHSQQSGIGADATSGQLARHTQAIPVYLSAISLDIALLYYCWAGVHRKGGTLETLSGGRWPSWKNLLSDFLIALPFWVLWEAAAYGVNWLLGPSSAKSVDSLLPRSILEILIWIVLSMTAGFCEELAFRGYLQRQLHALSGNAVAAVLGQALVFGVAHSYQGWKPVIVISALGVLYGALAVWRKNLRANIIAHAWSDIWEGWLKFLLWR